MKSLANWSLLTALLSVTCLAQVTSFSFTSSPDSKIGLGESRTLTPEDGYSFAVQRNFQNGVSFSITNATHTDTWTLDFASSNFTALTPRFYQLATRFPFNTTEMPNGVPNPGLAFGGNGRFDDRLNGEFEVLEATYFENGSVDSFVANFRQDDELRLNGWNEGVIRYNAVGTATPVPESSTLGLAGAALCFVAIAARRRRQRS